MNPQPLRCLAGGLPLSAAVAPGPWPRTMTSAIRACRG
jgi:hypothetical protein